MKEIQAMKKNNTVYIITGPTAVGKSIIAFYLAKRINGEIVNCDSIQLYKHLNIGSAKPSEKEMSEIPHHLYGVIEPDDKITVARYQQIALKTIDDILDRGAVPIVCGGTGLYVNSILYDMDFAARPEDNGKRRKELEEMANKMGSQYMYEYLSAIDPVSAERIHPNNTRKVIRAIEAYEYGSNVKDMEECRLRTTYDFRLFGITMERKWLYDRINRRVLELVKRGLLDEFKELNEKGYTENTPAMKAIGYKELYDFKNGKKDLKTAILDIMKNSRHYAKRQMTWLKRYDGLIHWIEIQKNQSVGEIVDEILQAEQ